MSATQVLSVTGMTCDHCVRAVTMELLAVPGVMSVDVSLDPDAVSQVSVIASTPLDEARLREAVLEAGYELVGVTG